MIDYLFIDNESGEQFFVECENFDECQDILDDAGFCWEDVELLGEYEPWEADILGYDTY